MSNLRPKERNTHFVKFYFPLKEVESFFFSREEYYPLDFENFEQGKMKTLSTLCSQSSYLQENIEPSTCLKSVSRKNLREE